MNTLDKNDMSQTLTTNQGSLKSKLNEIEIMIKTLNDRLVANRKSSQMLKGERETLKALLTMKSSDIKEHLGDELKDLENRMRQHFAHQKAENERIQQQITSLRADRNALKTQLITLQRRISLLEKAIGTEEF